MKRIISVLLSLMMICALCACDSSSNNGQLGKETTSQETSDVSAFSSDSSSTTSEVTSNSPNNISSVNKERVTCSMCNGTGSVKYYYGGSALEAALDGYNDYEYGPCTSCDGTGYTYVTVKESSGGKSNSGGVVCPSCGKRVSGLKTKQDAAGVSRSWCSSCWSDYNSIMGN